jgi:hypothetical protein
LRKRFAVAFMIGPPLVGMGSASSENLRVHNRAGAVDTGGFHKPSEKWRSAA